MASRPLLAAAMTLTLAAGAAQAAPPAPPSVAPPECGDLPDPDKPAAKAAADCIIAHPDHFDPSAAAYVTMTLWLRGEKAQALFWLYVLQLRSEPWPKGKVDELGQMRMSLASQILPWAGSDPAALRDVAARALAFEQRLGPGPAPPGVSAADWKAMVTKARKTNADGVAAFIANSKQNEKVLADRRRAAGLPVGPWQAPGSPLPAAWR